MEENNNLLSSEGSLLARINEYQNSLVEIDTGLVDVFTMKNGFRVYGYKIATSLVKNWTDDLTSVLKDEEAKKRINDNLNHLSFLTDMGLFRQKTIHALDGPVKDNKPDMGLYLKYRDSLSMVVSVLKHYTSKHFSSEKNGARLIK